MSRAWRTLAILAACATLVLLCAWSWRSPHEWQRVLAFCGIVAVAAWGWGRETRTVDSAVARGIRDKPMTIAGAAPDAAHQVTPAVVDALQQEQASLSVRDGE